MNRWRGKVAVVSGASSGIGLATAKSLIRHGMNVVGLARREDKMIHEMRKVEGAGKFHAIKCDVANEREVIDAFDYVRQTHKSLSVLINNAGIASLKTIEDSSMTELEQIIRVNLLGLLYCSKHGMKLMKENNDEGHVVNMNSIVGHKVPYPNWFKSAGISMNVYPVTKFAITALSEVFASELLGQKIRVTNLSPGVVITDLLNNSVGVKSGLSANPTLKSEDIADAIEYVIGTPSHVQITQLTIKPLGEPF